ncbi:MAG TPA: RHS repeat-associated core domain-containing protein [Clostridia bacterium]|nr:RHS repeat-associated core domain-containing protein [Clostridia bacterium]
MKKLKSIILLIIFMLAFTPLQTVNADTLEEYLNNLVGPKEQYDADLSPVYLSNNAFEETISPQNGGLTLVQTDYSLPGRNGLDLEIKRIYENSASNIKEMKVEWEDDVWVDYVEADEDTSTFFEDRYNLGIGTRFSFPSIEVKENDDGSSYMFLHTENGAVYRLDGPYENNNIKSYFPLNQTVKDVSIIEDSSFTNGQTDGTSKFLMTDKEGRRTYFAADGRVLAIMDRYGNTIKFEYSALEYKIDGRTKEKRLISKITDTVGRVVNIQYKENYGFGVKPVSTHNYSQEESYKESNNPDEKYSGDLEGRFQVIIELPNGRSIIYDKSAALVSEGSRNVIRTRLQRVYDVDGKVKFHYWYEQQDLGFTFMNGESYEVYNPYENLVQINDFKTNKITRYIYDTYKKSLGDKGSMQYRKIVAKEEMEKTGYLANEKDFSKRYAGVLKNRITYAYTREPDGFGHSGYNEGWDYLKDKYRYFTDVKDMKNAVTRYTYNGIHELVNIEESGPNHKTSITTEYDEKKFPIKTEKQIYNVVNGVAAGDPVKKIENFRYDEYGNMVNYTGPIANRDEKGYPVDSENTVTYNYAIDRFHVLSQKSWKKDSQTNCQIGFAIDGKGNIVQEKRLHTDNGDKSVLIDYQYDDYGNMTKKTVHSPEDTYITNCEYGAPYNGAYLTREYGVIDNRNVGKEYVYDFLTGDLKEEKAANGKITKYAYDLLHRVTKAEYPDGGVKLYQYNDYWNADREKLVTDQEGYRNLYAYDIFGNLSSHKLYDNDKWNVVSKFEYDSNGNKTKETDSNGHAVTYSYSSDNRLLQKAYLKNNAEVKEKLSLSYNYGAGSDTFLLVTITDEDGYVTRNHYDAAERLIAVDKTPDNNVFYTTKYAYDYDGSKISMTDAKGGATAYVYDDLNRLISQKDALNNQIIYVYNNLDQLVKKEEPGGKAVEFEYDTLGRAVKEKVYEKGDSDYTYKKYAYDDAGNILNITEGMVEGGADIPSAVTDYEYDSMNRVTDEYRKVDASTAAHVNYRYDLLGNRTQATEFINSTEDRYIIYNYDYNPAGKMILDEGYLQDVGNVRRGYYKTVYTYDYADNMLTKEELTSEEKYRTTTLTYDYRNRIIKRTEPFGAGGKTKVTSYEYDGRGNVKAEIPVVSGIAMKKTYKYDGMGDLVRVSDLLGNITRYAYDGNRNRIKEIDPRHTTVSDDNKPEIFNTADRLEYEYDAVNRLVKTAAVENSKPTVIQYREYDGRGNPVKYAYGEGFNPTNPSASIGEEYEYDVHDRVVGYKTAETVKRNTEKGENDYSARYTYDGSGRILKEIDITGYTTSSSYYMNGMLKEKVYADGSKESYTYDLTGKAESVKTDKKNQLTKSCSNIFGKPYFVIYPDNTQESFEYSFTGELKQSADKMGNRKYYEYDQSGNLIGSIEYIKSDDSNDYFRMVKNTYNEMNSITSRETFLVKKAKASGTETLEAAGDLIIYTYDNIGRLKKTIGPKGRETENDYDRAGNITTKSSKINGENRYIERYAYDLQSRIMEKSTLLEKSDLEPKYLIGAKFDTLLPDKVKASVTYEYYSNGTVKSELDPSGNKTSYEYDLDRHMTKKTDPVGNITKYYYNQKGNLVEEINPNNASTEYRYDEMNRFIGKIVSTAGGGRGNYRYLYDVMGNRIMDITPNNYESSKDTPDLAGTMAGTKYEYDAMNRLISTASPYGDITKYNKYDMNGNLIKVVDGLRYNGNPVTSPGTEYSYDGLNRLVTTTDVLGNSESFVYDVLDNLVGKTDTRGNVTSYEYDADRTLRKVTYPDTGVVEYTYDGLGRKLTEKDQRGNITAYTYNGFGKLKSRTDAMGGTEAYKFDLNGNTVRFIDANDGETTFSYDGNNRLKEKKTPIEGSHYMMEKYEYDALGNVLSHIATGTRDTASVRGTNYTYYPGGQVETVSDSGGRVTKNFYDKNGNVIKTMSQRDGDNYDITRYEYDKMDRQIKSIILIDRDYLYNASELPNISALRDEEHPDKVMLITAYEYDILGNRTKVTEPKGFVYDEEAEYTAVYGYDELNRIKTVRRMHNGNDITLEYFYDEAGNRIKEINERGFTTEYTYDSMNRVLTKTDALGREFIYEYDLSGNKLKETNAKGDSISYSYDGLNRVETVTDPYDVVINAKVYDKKGNIIKEIDAKGYLSEDTNDERYGTEYEYNLAGQAVKVTNPESGVTRYEYDQFGQAVKKTDALGNTTLYEYDSMGRLVKVTDPMETITQYSYDKAGNKLTTTDGRGKLTSYGYGDFGLMVSMKDADGREMTYKYDAVMKQAYIKDRNGNEITFRYDNRGLLTERKALDSGITVSFTYDEAGNRASMTDETGSCTYEYNGNNLLEEIEKNGDTQISYTYDEIGNIESVTDKLGNTTEYTYDKSSRMKTVTNSGRTTAYEYDKNGNRESVAYDSGVTEEYQYDRNNGLLSLVNTRANGSEISGYTYTYDKAGRQISKTDSYGTTEYTYDAAGRIEKVEAPGKTTIYSYDRSGNRLSQLETYTSEQTIGSIDGTNMEEIKYIIKKIEYVYSNTNQLLKLTEKMLDAEDKEMLEKATTYRYDNNGNQLRQTAEYILPYVNTYIKTYTTTVYGDNMTEPIHKLVEQVSNTFDPFNRLVKAESIKAGVRTVVEYKYNGDDLRTQKTVRRSDKDNTAEITGFLYDRQHVILETDGSDNAKVSYARGINYISREDASGRLSNYLYNGHGDVVQTVSEDGAIENQYDYDIFGNPVLTVESYDCAIRFAGEYYDSETGLYYLRARYYDPYIGRFISEDSYWGEDDNPLSLNLYTYCENDPVNFIDPTGHGREEIKAEIAQIRKVIREQQAIWWYEVHYNNASRKKSEWNEVQREAHRRANELRAQLAELQKALRELEEAEKVEDEAKEMEKEAKDDGTGKKGLDAASIKSSSPPEAGKKDPTEQIKPKVDEMLKPEQQAKPVETKAVAAANTKEVLGVGDQGDGVKKLQELLIGAGITEVKVNGKVSQLEADGKFGAITEAAVKAYQEKKGLKQDGTAGPKTLNKLIGSNFNSYAEILDKKQSGKGRYNNDSIEEQRLNAVEYNSDNVEAQSLGDAAGEGATQGTGNAYVALGSVIVKVPAGKYPETAQHIKEAVNNGYPDELTIDRKGARANRAASLKGHVKSAGLDLDEYPPAMFKEGGEGASVKPIKSSDNRGSGASIGNQLRVYPDGTKVKIVIDDDDDSDNNTPGASGGGSGSYTFEQKGIPLGSAIDENGKIRDGNGNIIGYYDYEKNNSYTEVRTQVVVPIMNPSGGFNFNFGSGFSFSPSFVLP